MNSTEGDWVQTALWFLASAISLLAFPALLLGIGAVLLLFGWGIKVLLGV